MVGDELGVSDGDGDGVKLSVGLGLVTGTSRPLAGWFCTIALTGLPALTSMTAMTAATITRTVAALRPASRHGIPRLRLR